MKYEIKKDLNHKYLVIDNGYKNMHSYELKILADENIDELLKVEFEKSDSGIKFQYDITNCISMLDKFKDNNFEAKDLLNIFRAVLNVTHNLDNYFLFEESVIIVPNIIFYDNDIIKFCYLPGFNQDITLVLKEMMSFILKHLNYKDPFSVECIYEANKLIDEGILNLQQIVLKLEQKIAQTAPDQNENYFADKLNRERNKLIENAAKIFYNEEEIDDCGVLLDNIQLERNLSCEYNSLDDNEYEECEECEIYEDYENYDIMLDDKESVFSVLGKKTILECSFIFSLLLGCIGFLIKNGSNALQFIASIVVCMFLCAYTIEKNSHLISGIKKKINRM